MQHLAAYDQDPELQALKKNFVLPDFLGAIAGLVPFVLAYSESASTSVTTTGTSMSTSRIVEKHMDYVALAGGGVAVLCALVGLAFIGQVRSRGTRLAIFGALVALGLLQVARGVIA